MEMRNIQRENSKDAESGMGYANKGYKEDHGSLDDVVVSVDGVPVKSYVSEPLEAEEYQNCCVSCISTGSDSLSSFYEKNKTTIWRIILFVLVCLYAAYFIYAMYYSFGDEGSIRLLWVTCVVILCIIYYLIKKHFGEQIYNSCLPCIEKFSGKGDLVSWIIVGIVWFVVIIYIIVDVAAFSKNPYNLVSAVGIIVYVSLMFIFSYSPARVKWRPVAWGLALQFVFALLILKWPFGYQVFNWLGDRVTEFLSHTDAGSRFLFGDRLIDEFVFAFRVLSVIIFFSMAISILYYLGVMQAVIPKVAWIMQISMGTTAAESLNAAGNIFIGQSEAPLLIRPLIQNMTRSELHAVMTGGFATIAGSVLGAYILFGVPANHLLSASVMSAPAALAMAKLFYPETEKSKTTVKDVEVMEKSDAKNIVEAASAGASASISLVANIGVNLIAFIALLEFFNQTLRWFGARVGLLPPDIDFTFEFITSYVLWPFAFIMGVEAIDCRQVARLIGLKTFLNEFVAYSALGVLTANRKNFTEHVELYNGTYEYDGSNIKLLGPPWSIHANETLKDGIIHTDRSLVISTYALCGFSNFASIGIMIGTLSAMAPHRRADLSSIAVRAMIAGNVACFMTACIAGIFYEGDLS